MTKRRTPAKKDQKVDNRPSPQPETSTPAPTRIQFMRPLQISTVVDRSPRTRMPAASSHPLFPVALLSTQRRSLPRPPTGPDHRALGSNDLLRAIADGAVLQQPPRKETPTFKFFIKDLKNKKTFGIRINPSSTVGVIVGSLQKQGKLEPNTTLMHNGRAFQDHVPFEEYGVQEGDDVEVVTKNNNKQPLTTVINLEAEIMKAFALLQNEVGSNLEQLKNQTNVMENHVNDEIGTIWEEINKNGGSAEHVVDKVIPSTSDPLPFTTFPFVSQIDQNLLGHKFLQAAVSVHNQLNKSAKEVMQHNEKFHQKVIRELQAIKNELKKMSRAKNAAEELDLNDYQVEPEDYQEQEITPLDSVVQQPRAVETRDMASSPILDMPANEVGASIEENVENQMVQLNRAQSPAQQLSELMLDDNEDMYGGAENYEDLFDVEVPTHGDIIAEKSAVPQAAHQAAELRDAATSPIFQDRSIRNRYPEFRLPDSDISFLVQTYNTDFRVYMRQTDPVSEIKKEYSRRYGTPESNLRCFVAGQTGEAYGGFTIAETGMIKQDSVVYMMEGPAYVRPPRYGH